MVDLSIIIVSYNSFNDIKANIKSIEEKINNITYEVIIINNFTGDEKIRQLSIPDKPVRIIEAGANLGFAKANNIGLDKAEGKYILFLNPDVIILSEVDRLVNYINENRNVGLIGPRTLKTDMSLLPSCGEFPALKNWCSYNFFLNNIFPKVKLWGNYPMNYFRYSGTWDVDWISGAFMLGRKEVLDETGAFDESFFMYGEDVDICWSMHKHGYRVIFSDDACIIHKVGHSVKKKSAKKALLMVKGFYVLSMKHYNRNYARLLMLVLFCGSFLRKIFWSLLYYSRLNRRKENIDYYNAMMKETFSYLNN